MKRYQYILLGAIASFSFIGCSKNLLENDTRSGQVSLKAYFVEDQQTKSEYTLVGDTYQFAWSPNDKFVVQTYNGGTYDEDVFTTTTGGRPEGNFTGNVADGYTLQNYAFYPNVGDGATSYTNNLAYRKVAITPIAPNASVTSETATVTLAGTITEDKDYPMAHIPMIGVKDSNGDYRFTPCTGVLKITIKDFPTTATQVRLKIVSGSYALNGHFVFDTNYEIKASYAKESWGEKYLTVTPGSTVEDRSFYFPVPTGTITANKLELSVLDGAKAWCLGCIGSNVTVQQGVVTELPPVTYQAGVSVNIIGTSATPKARVRFADDQFIIFKITESTTTPTDKFTYNNYDGGKLGYAQTWTISGGNYFASQSTSGLKYFHYKVFNSDNTEAASGYVPFYYLASSHTSKFTKQFVRSTTKKGNKSDNISTGGTPSSETITFGVSDNPSLGNIKIVEYLGKDADETCTAYGNYNSAASAPQITFNNNLILCTEGSDVIALYSSATTTQFAIDCEVSAYGLTGDGAADLTLWNSWAGLKKNNSDLYWVQYFFADRKSD